MSISSCSKEEIEPAKESEIEFEELTGNFATEKIEVFDKSGINSIEILLKAKESSQISQYLKNWSYVLTPIYENNETDNFGSTKEDNLTSESQVQKKVFVETEIENVKLDSLATGFKLDVKWKGESIRSGYANETGYLKGPKYWHHAKAEWTSSNNSNDGIYIQFYTKRRSISKWLLKADHNLYYDNKSATYYYKDYRLAVKVFHNFENYAIYFKHWSGDEWELK